MIFKRFFLFFLFIITIYFLFSFDYEYFKPSLDEQITEQSSQSSSSKKVTKNAKPKQYQFLSQKLTSTEITRWYFSSDQIKGYLKSFNYECLYLRTDKGTDITLFINTDDGSLKAIRSGNHCEREIFLEESLIEDIRTEGFKAGNIRNYLKKVDLPTGMYFKAIKVFTVG